MKIAIDINELTLKQNTGVKVYTREIVRALSQIDEKNEYLLYLNDRKQKGSTQEYGANIILTDENIRSCVPANFKLKIIKSKFSFWTYTKLPQEIKKDKPDVLFMPIQASPFIKKPENVKTIITIHDLAFLFFPEYFTFKDRFLLNFHTKRAVRAADKIIAPSETTKKDIMKFYKVDENKIKVIYHGIKNSCHSEEAVSRRKKDETRDGILRQAQDDNSKNNVMVSLPNHQDDNPYILFVGTIQPRKNLIKLIEAFEILKINPPNPPVINTRQALLQRGNYNIKLIIAGDKGWMADEIYQKAKESEFSDKIIFTGGINDNELNNLYKNAFVFVLPSLYEGFGLPVLEAMSYGVPVICSDNSSLPEIAGGAALLVNPYNTQEIAEAINKVFTDDKLRNKMIERGLKNAKKFTWIKTADEFLEILKEI